MCNAVKHNMPISYRQGGIRYPDILSHNSIPLILEFDSSTMVYARDIWAQLTMDSKFNYINFTHIYQNSNPVNLEIGIGNGEFLVHHATLNPNENFLGIEVFKDAFLKAGARIKNAGITNCKIIQFDAALILRLIPPTTLNAIYVNFPDPWYKNAHKKRRLLTIDFINQLANKLVKGGLLNIVTDHDDYARSIASNIIQVPTLQSEFNSVYIRNLENYLPTKYYRKFVSVDGAYFFKFKSL